jgi:hypothetical protein
MGPLFVALGARILPGFETLPSFTIISELCLFGSFLTRFSVFSWSVVPRCFPLATLVFEKFNAGPGVTLFCGGHTGEG